MEADTMRRRLRGMAWLLGLVLVALGGRLVQVQCLSPVEAGPGEGTQQRVVRPALRGKLLDSRGLVLAQSRWLHDLYADPVVVGTNGAWLARVAGRAFGVEPGDLEPRFAVKRVERHTRTVEPVGGAWVTNVTVRAFTNRSVLVLTNVEDAVLERYREAVREAKLPRLEEVEREIEALQKDMPKPLERLRLLATGRRGELREQGARLRGLRKEMAGLRDQKRTIEANAIVALPVEHRAYPLGHAAVHVLGHVTNGFVTNQNVVRHQRFLRRSLGAAGIEAKFDSALLGVPGLVETRVARGRELVSMRGRELAARDGLNVRLTLDAHLQSIVEQAMDEGVAAIAPEKLVCIVVRPSTGEILALANRPCYDPNRLGEARADGLPNWALGMGTDPGSTFKMVTYSAALDLGLATLDGTVNCHGGTWQPSSGRPVRDVEGHGLSVVTLEEAFAKSSNVAAAQLGLGMRPDQLMDYIRRFGFLARTGILAPAPNRAGGESSGGIDRPDRMNVERQGRLSYGYGILVTPLQTVMAAAAIANDGVRMKPMLVRSLEEPDGTVVARYEPEVGTRVMKPETAAQMRRAMRAVVQNGTAKAVAMEDFEVAGKTGTAHQFVDGRQSSEKYVSTFVGFLPADRPELCILVLAHSPEKRGPGSYFGGKACGPIFKTIARHAANHLGLVPSARTNDASAVVRGAGTFPGAGARTP
jgi:cell division protein FtsI/penicillin-binding protein 2